MVYFILLAWRALTSFRVRGPSHLHPPDAGHYSGSISGQPPTVGTGERASPGSVMHATSSGLQQGHHVEIEPSTLGPPLNDSDQGWAKSPAEGHVHETLVATLSSHKLPQSRNGPYCETSPYRQEDNLQVSHGTAIEHPTPFSPPAKLRVDRGTVEYLRLEGESTPPTLDVYRTFIRT